MTPIEIIPHGRGKSDAVLYKYLRWQARVHRRELEDGITQAMLQRILYGDTRRVQRPGDPANDPV